MKKIILFSLFVCGAFTISAQENNNEDSVKVKPRTTIQVRPAGMSFNLDRGQTKTMPVTITNNKSNPYSFRLYMEDYTKDSAGNIVRLPDSTYPNSCKQWISLDRNFVEVAPNTTENIMLTMSIPDNEAAGQEMKWTMMYAESVMEKAPPQLNGDVETVIGRAFRIGIHIVQIPPAANAHKEVRMLSFEALPDFNKYRIMGKNTGTAELKCRFILELSSLETGEKITLSDEAVGLFPQQVRYVDVQIPTTVPPGKYSAIALIEPGDDTVPLEAAQKEIIVN